MLVLVADTNLFHEFRPLEDIPWQDLGELDEIIIVVSDPVQTELDEHKKSTKPRLRRRASDLTKKFREMVLAENFDLLIKASNPKVLLRLDYTAPSNDRGLPLDLTVPDDQLVAIALTLSRLFLDAKFCVFSDDLRPLRKAKQVGLQVISIPDSWRREPEQTDEEKETKKLLLELANLKKQEPVLDLKTLSGEEIYFPIPFYPDLSEDDLNDLMTYLQEKCPPENNFKKNYSNISATFGYIPKAFQHAKDSEIKKYLEDDYPQWIEMCRQNIVNNLARFNGDQKITIDFELINVGTRPANDFRISFETRGDIVLTGADQTFGVSRVGIKFPKPPTAPQGKWIEKELFPSNINIFGERKLANFDLELITRAPNPIKSLEQPDPNLFYYRKYPSLPVSSFELTCLQFRHAGTPERFSVNIHPNASYKGESKNALLQIKCEASNLTKPLILKVNFYLTRENLSAFDYFREAIASNMFGYE